MGCSHVAEVCVWIVFWFVPRREFRSTLPFMLHLRGLAVEPAAWANEPCVDHELLALGELRVRAYAC